MAKMDVRYRGNRQTGTKVPGGFYGCKHYLRIHGSLHCHDAHVLHAGCVRGNHKIPVGFVPRFSRSVFMAIRARLDEVVGYFSSCVKRVAGIGVPWQYRIDRARCVDF